MIFAWCSQTHSDYLQPEWKNSVKKLTSKRDTARHKRYSGRHRMQGNIVDHCIDRGTAIGQDADLVFLMRVLEFLYSLFFVWVS